MDLVGPGTGGDNADFLIPDLKDFSGNLETVSEAYEDIYESSEDEGEIVFVLFCSFLN